MKTIIYSLIVLMLIPLSSTGKEVSIKGTVLAFNLYPLKGVKISTKKSTVETTTNEKGEFDIVISEKDFLIIEADGFFVNKRKLKNYSEPLKINMVFKGSESNIKEAVSQNYISETDLAYGISNFSYSNIDYSIYTNIYDMIRGSFPNVTIINENGVKQFQLGGEKSLMASNYALIVVNGMALTNGDISFLSPYDVKKVEIIKGPAASEYGSRGANGVVVINTRRQE